MTVDAFAEIYASYYKPVYNYINTLAKDKALAEDLTQDALIKVLGGLKDVDESRKLSSWIFRIAHNTFVDYYRGNRVKYEPVGDIAYYASETNCPEYIYLNTEKYDKVKEALSRINEKCRAVLILRVFKELSYKEIAVQLKLKESTVKTLIHRGRQQFLKSFAEVYQA